VDSVSADLATFVDRPAEDGAPYRPANDSAVVALRFANGAHGTLTAKVVAHEAERKQSNTIVLQGEAGTVELQHTFAGATLRGARAEDTEFRELDIPAEFWAGVDPASPQTAGQVHSVGDRAFLDAIVHDTAIAPSFYDGWQVQRVLEAAFDAAETRTWQPLQQENPS
jgi:predicted dehydrogenase